MTKRKTTPDIMGLLGGSKEENKSTLKGEKELTKQAKPVESNSNKGLAKGYTRATFVMQEEQLQRLKSLAYYQRLPIKAVVADALDKYLKARVTDEVMGLYLKNSKRS